MCKLPMEKTISKGDVVIVNKKYNNLKEEDIIAYNYEGKIVVHRINEIIYSNKDSDMYIYTKGDANKEKEKTKLSKKNTNIVDVSKKTNVVQNPKNIKKENIKKELIKEKTNNRKKFYFSFEMRVISFFILFIFLLLVGIVFFVSATKITHKEKLSYDEKGNIDYTVCLKQNDFYEDKCISNNMTYVASRINNINLTYNYSLNINKDILAKNNFEYEVTAKLVIQNNEDMTSFYEKDYTILSRNKNDLYIDGIKATVRIDKDIRIMNFKVNKVNNAVSLYEDYNVNNVSGEINLLSNDSYIIYDVDIYNLENVVMGIKDITSNNDNLNVEILDYNLKDKLCSDNVCTLGVKKTIRLKISYKNGVTANDESNKFILNFKFGRIYNISYFKISDSDKFPKEVIEGDTLNLNVPNYEEYLIRVFMNNKLLYKDIDYQYKNDRLVISNISGDIQIHYKMPICQRATFLHTEECLGAYCSRMVYKVDGSYGTTTITYGSLGTTGSLASGDAFDCDVNGDGVYDSKTERFYYVTDMENNSNIAIFLHYNNVSEGKPSNEKYYQYDSSGENWHGPRTAIEQRPTTSQWSNVSLSNTERKLVNEYGTTSTKDGHTYPEVFSYSKYAARFLTLSEVKKIVNFYIPSLKNGELDNHMYLVENTNFSKKDNSKFDGYWLETPRNTMSNHGWMIYATARRVHSVEVQRTDVLIGVRPVIEVSKNDISY